MIITRDELVHILGQEAVEKAEKLPEEEFEELKWENLSTLLQAYDRLCHTAQFEARRSFLLGLEPTLRVLLVRHVFESGKIEDR